MPTQIVGVSGPRDPHPIPIPPWSNPALVHLETGYAERALIENRRHREAYCRGMTNKEGSDAGGKLKEWR